MKHYLIIIAALILTTCASSNLSQNSGDFEDMIAAGKDLVVRDKTFDRDIDFTQFENSMISEGISQVRIISAITFINCTFNGKVVAYARDDENNALITTFQSSLSFIGCTFNEEVNFKASSISGRADFKGSTFYKTANFEEVTFFQNAYFRKSIFHGEHRFQHAVFMQKAYFLDAEFDGTASFQRAIFHSETQFSNARFMGYTDYSNISCFGNFYANFAEFADRLIFNNAFLYRRTEINNSSINYCEMNNCQFFGLARFAEVTVLKQMNIENTYFLLGVPDFGSVDQSMLQLAPLKPGN